MTDSQDKNKEYEDQLVKLHSIFKSVFSSDNGNAVIEHLKDYCFYHRTHNGSEYCEGQRSVILHILNIINLEETKKKIDAFRNQQDNDNIIW